MSSPLCFHLLGPVTGSLDGRPLELGDAPQRAVLALLLHTPGRVRPAREIITDVWGADPRVGPDAVHRCVGRLNDALAGTDGQVSVLGDRSGYAIRIPEQAVDWLRFRARLGRAQQVRPNDPAAAITSLREAVGPWLGPPLADLAPHLLAALREQMCDQYLGAVEDLAELEIGADQAAAAAARLDQVVTGHPHRTRAADLLVRALTAVAEADRLRGRYGQAADHFARVLQIARRTGNRASEQHALTCLGYTHRVRGRYVAATEYYAAALEVARATGDRQGEAHALRCLGHLHRVQGRYEPAVAHYAQSLDLARRTANHAAEHNARYGLGLVHLAKGEHTPALDQFARALTVARAAGSGTAQFDVLDGLGRTYLTMDRFADALAKHQDALAIATDLGHPTNQARAHDGLAHTHRGEGNRERARQHWQAALDILTTHGLEHTYDPAVTVHAIQAQLAALDGTEPT